jgi:hypothetical protein
MRCDHCQTDSSNMPGWKHEVRAPDKYGTVEHLWWAKYSKRSVHFAIGVSVKRVPSDSRPFITGKIKPVDSGASPVTFASGDVVAAAIRMVGDGTEEGNALSMMATWTANIWRSREPKQWKYLPAKDEPIPF